MKGKDVGYKRVSSVDQNPERQLEGYLLDKVFIEYASGNSMKRPVLLQMMEYVRDDDTVIVHSMDRLGRNIRELLKVIDDLVAKGVTVKFIKENLSFNGDDSALSRLLLTMLAAVAEFELSIIKERQREGIAIAKKAGKYKGRKSALNTEAVKQLSEIIGNKRQTKAQIATQFGISVNTLYKYKRLIEKECA